MNAGRLANPHQQPLHDRAQLFFRKMISLSIWVFPLFSVDDDLSEVERREKYR
jgi:hypothetical protein